MTALPLPPAPPPPSALSKKAYIAWVKRLLAFLIDWASIYIFLTVQALALPGAVDTAGDTGLHRRLLRQGHRLLLDLDAGMAGHCV